MFEILLLAKAGLILWPMASGCRRTGGRILTIEKGEAIGFVGSTGAGKSILIDIVLGVLTPTAGKLLVDGVDIRTDTSA